MSFFNLTQLGSDDPVKAAVIKNINSGHKSENDGSFSRSSRFGETVLPNSMANGSHDKYTTMLQKHLRPNNGPNDIYNKPVTTNMKYGWWMKDGVEKEAWTKTDRHSCVHSEMTRHTGIAILCGEETEVDVHVRVLTLRIRNNERECSLKIARSSWKLKETDFPGKPDPLRNSE